MGRVICLMLATAAAAAAVSGLALAGSSAETISMTIRPVVLRANQAAMAAGTVGSGRVDQLVTMQFRPCRETVWREVAETSTHDGGGWTVDVAPGIGGLIRAVSGGATSQAVELKQEPYVSVTHRPPGTFSIHVNAQRSFWRKYGVLERFDPKGRAWIEVRRALFTESGAPPGVPWIFSKTEKFRVAVPKGTKLRAKLPGSQARPCYLPGTSNVIER